MLNALTIILLFAAAWAVSRLSAIVARRVMAWSDQRHRTPSGDLSAKIVELKRRETSVAVIRTGIAYIAFAAALILTAAQLTGGFNQPRRLCRRLLRPHPRRLLRPANADGHHRRLQHVRRALVLRRRHDRDPDVGGPGSRRGPVPSADEASLARRRSDQHPQLADRAVRVLPGGFKEFDVELVASSREGAELLIEHVAAILPEGPTTFIQRPTIHQVDELAPGLVRLRMRASVAPGREWLVNGFYTDLLKERADKHLIVHGPVVLTVDEGATRSFARASAATRWAGAR